MATNNVEEDKVLKDFKDFKEDKGGKGEKELGVGGEKLGVRSEELGVPKPYSQLAEMAIKAENEGRDEDKENKRMKAYRAVSAVSDLLGGLGNMIAVNNGAVPVSQENTMMDD